MKIPLVEYFKNRGVHSGLNQTSNSFKMAAYLVGPLLGLWIGIQLFAPPAYSDMLQGASFVFWFVYIIVFYAFKKAAASEYVAFPQSHWYFRDTRNNNSDIDIDEKTEELPNIQQVSYDVLIPSGGWEEIAKYPDKSRIYRVHFKDKLMFQDFDRPYPDVFDRALWKLPNSWNESFNRNGLGEFFFEGLFVNHPTCENISVVVVDWDERGSGRIPICLINSCSYNAKQALQAQGKAFIEAQIKAVETKDAAIADLKISVGKLDVRNRYLEQEHEKYSQDTPEDIRKLAEDRMEAAMKRHKTIMNLPHKSAWQRLLINGKYLVYFAIFLTLATITSHFLFGWP